MFVVMLKDGTVFSAEAADEVYVWQATDGRQFVWNVTKARRLAETRGEILTVSLSQMGVTREKLQALYPDLDEAHARSTDLSVPLLFLPFENEHLLLDGWHRLLHATMIGQGILPAYLLTEEEAEGVLLYSLPAGKGIDLLREPAA